MIENGDTCSSIIDNPDQLISCVSAELPPNDSQYNYVSTLKSHSFQSDGFVPWSDPSILCKMAQSLQELLGETRTYASMMG